MFQITIKALFTKAFLLVSMLYVVKCIEQIVPVQFVDGDLSEKRRLNLKEVLKENRQYSHFPEQCPSIRIHGGKPVSITEVPYQVALRKQSLLNFKSSLFCGGSLITLKHVVTAAHCFIKSNNDLIGLSNIRVVAGTEIASGTIFSMYKEHWRRIEHFYRHQYYNDIFLWNDIGIIEVQGQFIISSSVKPIRMHTNDLNLNLNEHVKCLVSGYGRTESNAITTNLRLVCVPIIKRSVCRTFYSRGLIHEDVLCAGTYGKDSCQGDSGGPIVCQGVLVGLVSFGSICGKSPGVYTQLSSYTKGDGLFVSESNRHRLTLQSFLILSLANICFADFNVVFVL